MLNDTFSVIFKHGMFLILLNWLSQKTIGIIKYCNNFHAKVHNKINHKQDDFTYCLCRSVQPLSSFSRVVPVQTLNMRKEQRRTEPTGEEALLRDCFILRTWTFHFLRDSPNLSCAS